MADPPVPQVSLSDLGPLSRIGSGGQGTVFALAEDPGLVYKEYAPRFVDDVDVATLGRFVRLATGDAGPDAEALLRLAAWPTAIVRKGGVVRGFLMPRVPEQYMVRLKLPAGPDTVLAQLQFLLNSDEFLRARGLAVDQRLRLELLRDTGEALATFHRLGICVGDFSPNNLLFSLTARPRCYFIDCDAMRLDGDSVLAQAETPEWHVPVPDGDRPAEELATPATDAYKFGLLAVRIFAGDQQVRDPAAAGPRLSGKVRTLAGRSLSADPDERPLPERWIGVLDAAIARTPAGPPALPEPDPPVPEPPALDPPVRDPNPQPSAPVLVFPPRVLPRPAASRGWWGLAPVLAIVLGVIFGLLDGNDEPTTPVGGRPVTFAPYAPYTPRPLTLPSYTVPRLPTGLPNGLPSYPWLRDPTPLYIDLCRLTDLQIGAGLDPKGARVKQATGPVQDFVCSFSRKDQDTGFAGRNGSAPDATQRARYAKLAAAGPYRKLKIIGTRTGPNGEPQVNVVFQPFAAVGADCWRSRLSLAKTEDGYGVSALTAPAAVSCG
jgi:eukaryotic-like serine/threonine-protein kinase